MINYLEKSQEIYNWLSRLQVKQDRIVAEKNEGWISFKLHHPLKGLIKVTHPLNNKEYFRCHGIGLKIVDSDNENVILNVYDKGGIFDPVDGYVPGDHYGSTYFAWLGALLYKNTNEADIMNSIRMAAEFHFSTSKEEYFFSEWQLYHWDFHNHALLETYRLIKDKLSDVEKKVWIRELRNSKENRKNLLTNWVLMRAYSDMLRYTIFNDEINRWKCWINLLYTTLSRHKDGCYDDRRNRSRPIQYHVFVLALLHRIYLLNSSNIIKKYFLTGLNYFVKFIDPDGCFNYTGRGQEQIFGYASAIYVLEAAKILDPINANYYDGYLCKMWNHLNQYQVNDEGYYHLVLNNHEDKEMYGWYDYHHLTVYNAFLAVWIGLADELQNRSSIKKNVKYNRKFFNINFKPTRTTIIYRPEYYIVFSGGASDYLSEPGITPYHIWFKDIGWVFSCPNGPSTLRYGKKNRIENIEKNILAPVVKLYDGTWDVPLINRNHRFNSKENCLMMTSDYKYFFLERVVQFYEEKIQFEDKFVFKGNSNFSEFRFFNFPVAIDKFKIVVDKGRFLLLSKSGNIVVSIHYSDFISSKVEVLELLQSAKGDIRIVAMRDREFKKDNKFKKICFSIKREK